MIINALINNRSIFLIIVVVLLWLLHVPSHRSSSRTNKLKVPRLVAILAGSKNDWVNWRAFSYQIGLGSLLFWHFLSGSMKLGPEFNIFFLASITMIIAFFSLRYIWNKEQKNA